MTSSICWPRPRRLCPTRPRPTRPRSCPRPSPPPAAATAITRAMVADIVTYLPGDLLVKVDLASMAHSLECRGPFLDHRVVELAAAMPLDRKIQLRSGRSKVVLKQAFADLLPPPIKTRSEDGLRRPDQPVVPGGAEERAPGRAARSGLPGSGAVPPRGDREAGRRARRRKTRALAPPLGAAHARIVVSEAAS